MAVGRYSGPPEDVAEVDGFAAGDGAEEQALNTGSKAQEKTNERDILIKPRFCTAVNAGQTCEHTTFNYALKIVKSAQFSE